jgi:(E)-4-hydroxy-3-methyl-but-2-enyl pyrophosphate reductase
MRFHLTNEAKKQMKISIDPGAGPCFGVQKAIDKAEEVLNKKSRLICMGDLIHNESENHRLSQLGMVNLNIEAVLEEKPEVVLFRAHGEPPESYGLMKKQQIDIIDATCPIVLNLQKKIRETHHLIKKSSGYILIYGQSSHAEVISLMGNCENTASIIEKLEEVHQLDLSQPIYLFSQTTKYRSTYQKIRDAILQRLASENIDSSRLHFHDSSCKIVARRDEQLQEFISDKDAVLFVSGSKSSNGKQLFEICKNTQPQSFFISYVEDVKAEMILNKKHIGISGATSTPHWLLQEVEKKVKEILNPV